MRPILGRQTAQGACEVLQADDIGRIAPTGAAMPSSARFDGFPLPPLRLAHFDGEGWQTWTAPDAIRPGILYWDEKFLPLVVGPDGSVWLRNSLDGKARWCDGVARFDGATWSTYLPRVCVVDIEPAPDGSVLVAPYGSASGGYESQAGVYRISPSLHRH